MATWLLFYAGFYVMQILLAFYTLGSFRWEVLHAGRGVVPDLHAARCSTSITGKEQKWHVTGGKRQGAIAVQLHDPAGAGVLLPAAHLGRGHLARHQTTAS